MTRGASGGEKTPTFTETDKSEQWIRKRILQDDLFMDYIWSEQEETYEAVQQDQANQLSQGPRL